MMTTNEFLDAVKSMHGLTSDYKLALVLGTATSGISNYRAGRSRLDDRMAVRVADLLDVEPAYVISCVHAERAGMTGDDNLAGIWRDLAADYARSEKKLRSFTRAEPSPLRQAARRPIAA